MANLQVIVYDEKKYLIKVLTGWTAACILMLCLILPKVVFAHQPAGSLQQEFPSNPTNIHGVPAQQVEDRSVDGPLPLSTVSNEDAMNEPEAPSLEEWKVVRMRVTAYCPCSQCCGSFSDGITACNHQIQNGDRFVAADKLYAFGTEMIIPGYNKSLSVEVKDRGGAIQGDRLDVFFNTHQEALEWGVQFLDVLVKSP